MANPEHLKILKQGVVVWNRWREANPEIRPELLGAKLHGAHLKGVNFEGATLAGANLEDARLNRAVLRLANLRAARFEGADLRRADLRDADLRRARLRDAVCSDALVAHANLEAADLRRANLDSAGLEHANLRKAKFGLTSIGDVDLSLCEGLEETMQRFPSSIGIDTLEQTAAGLSTDPTRRVQVESFLRGSGLSEAIMEVFSRLIDSPIELYSCFTSYSHADSSFARRLHDQLHARGIRCWLDEHDMKPGDRILDVVNDAIRLHDKILLCCSETSLNSWWVKDEIRKAQERERTENRDIIIPLMVDRYLLDGSEDGLAADLRSRLAADFTGWEHDNAKFEERFERVVKALRTDEGARENVPEAKL